MRGIPTALALSLAGLLVLCGCGYTFRSTLDERYQTIHVAAFQNASGEYDLQAPLTNAVIRKFMNDRRLRVVNQGNADLVLEGTILAYELSGATFGATDDVTQFLSSISVRVEVRNAGTGELLWHDPALQAHTSVLVGVTPAANSRLRGNDGAFLNSARSFRTTEENTAASEILEQLASDIFIRTVEPW